jgi:glucose-6-phosphate isomerase
MLTFNHHYNTTTDPKSDAIIQKALNTVTHEMESDTIGYYKLPKGSMELLPTLESIDMSGISQIVVMGIGGSSLGLKAVDALLRPYTLDAKEILYFENSDPLTILEI